jgi:hypothetical protein
MVAANTLNKQPWTTDKGGTPALGLDVGLTTLHCKKNKLVPYSLEDLYGFFR